MAVCLFVGDEATGKTSIVTQYGENTFSQQHIPHGLEKYETEVKLKGMRKRLVTFEIWDSGGSSYMNFSKESLSPVSVILMCFAINSPTSLENIATRWCLEMKCLCPNARIVLVGTKTDLRREERTMAELSLIHQVPVKQSDGKAMSKRIGACKYVECSAKLNKGLENVFRAAIKN